MGPNSGNFCIVCNFCEGSNINRLAWLGGDTLVQHVGVPKLKKKNRDNFFSKVDWLNQAFIDQNQFFLPEGDGDEVIEENNNEKKTSGESYDFFNTQMGLTKKDVNLLSKFILCSFMLRDCVWDCKMHKYAPLISMVLFT